MPGTPLALLYGRPDGTQVSILDTANGVEVMVIRDGGTWPFLIDCFYIDGKTHEDGPLVQAVIYNPADLDGDPLLHVKVLPDGRLEQSE